MEKMTVKQIVEWIDDAAAESLEAFKEEPDKNNNHLATSYLAEYEILVRLKDEIYGVE